MAQACYLRDFGMSDLFDVSKETILITGASRWRDHAAGIQRLALDDRQRGDGRRRVFAELRGSLPRHCEPTGRANARPMINSAKQSMPPRKERMDCFVALLLAMTTQASACRSIHPHLGLDHISGFFADHDGRRMGVTADRGRQLR